MADLKTVTINGVTYKIEDPDALSGTDTTLTQQNKAADAAAVGAALAGKVPAGYGLGVQQPKDVGSADNAIANGWYIVTDPRGGTGTGWLLCSSYSETYKRHDFYNVGTLGDTHLVRWMKNGTWEQWEYVDPPMIPGEEYRTTERWNGKAVWTSLITLGAYTAGEHTVTSELSANRVIRSAGSIGGFSMPEIYQTSVRQETYGAAIQCGVNGGNLFFRVVLGSSYTTASNVSVQVWYTKD